MRSDGVVVVPPDRQSFSRMAERGEQRLVEQLVTQPPVEALDESVLLWLAGRNVMPLNPCIL